MHNITAAFGVISRAIRYAKCGKEDFVLELCRTVCLDTWSVKTPRSSLQWEWSKGGSNIFLQGLVHTSFTFFKLSSCSQLSVYGATPRNPYLSAYVGGKGRLESHTCNTEITFLFLTTWVLKEEKAPPPNSRATPFPAIELNIPQKKLTTHTCNNITFWLICSTYLSLILTLFILNTERKLLLHRGPGYNWSKFETPWNHFVKSSLECYPILIPFHLSTWNSNNFSDKVTAFKHPNICENCYNYFQLTNGEDWKILTGINIF